nr:M48 family metalloprotease [Acinetobacter piscicola]
MSTSQQTEVPEIGSGVGIINKQLELIVGEKVLRKIRFKYPLINDVWLEDQFFIIFNRLVSQTQLGEPIGLVIIRDPDINAFAQVGGVFALNAGLVISAKNMDQVASVMGHEIAHVTQRHFSRGNEAINGQSLLSLLGLVAGAVLASKANVEAGTALMYGAQALAIDNELHYSRSQEREADRIGMQYLYSAGYNPEGMPEFFENLQQRYRPIGFFPDFWSTHPLTAERMSETKLRASQYPRIPYSNSQQDFEIIKWYLAVVSSQATEEQLYSLASQKNMEGLLALAKYQSIRGDYQNAQIQLNLAKKINSEHALVTLIQTDIYLGQNKINDAYQVIVSKQRITPENRALSYKLAEVYIRQNKSKEAEQLVNRFINNNNRDISGWQLLQQAANLDKANPMRTVNVLRNRSEVQYWSGDEENAIKTLLHAQRLAKENNAMSAKIEARLKVMQDEQKFKI